MDKEVIDNHTNYLKRLEFYRSFGYDLEGERDFILEKSLPLSGNMLEIGTGKGHFALALAKRGFSFISVDISQDEQEIARLNLRYYGLEKLVTLKIENAEKLSFPDRSFDVIFSINVFHHLYKPEAVLNEMDRLLRPAGKVVLSDFNAKGFEIINACHTAEGRVHDRSRHDLDEAKQYFAHKGFEVSECHSKTQRVLVAQRK
ncbi:MAG: class I SAM-dependent methyltransferase [Candidatus Omnitrophica bacterium]|nr:class I SAM-dependent methyltransferase [Candidatus Omnitrophota bacterium]MCM8791506.1 class I SAM-dependent methyltransferase [Candidatus Omnitrophota bacterium]